MLNEKEKHLDQTMYLIRMNAGTIQDKLNVVGYILEGMEAVLVMMMSVETNQKAVANMLLSCVSTAQSNIDQAHIAADKIREG